MIRPSFILVSFLVLIGAAAPASAETVDRMTCAAARKQALTGRYEKMAPWGVTPIFGFLPGDDGGRLCPRDTDPVPVTERTLDERRCLLGWNCAPRIRVR